MKTTKMTAKEILELKEFKAVNGKGVVTEFEVVNGVVINKETGKEMKADSIRRSYEIITEEEQEEVQEVQPEIVKGSFVVTDNNEVGIVEDIHKNLVTVLVKVEDELVDIPQRLENLVLADETHQAEIEAIEKLLNKEQEKKVEKVEKVQKPRKEIKKAEHLAVAIPPVELVDSEYKATEKHYKSVITLRINHHDLRITEYGGYITDVRVLFVDVNETGDIKEEVLYKSPKMSVRDTLQWMGYDEPQVKALGKVIKQIRTEVKKSAQA